MPRARIISNATLSPLARRIAERRDALGLRQVDIARGAGLAPQILSRLLCGQQADLRDRKILTRLAGVLKTTPDWLEGATADPTLPPPPPQPRRAMVRPAPRPLLSADDVAAYEADAQQAAEDAAARADDPIETFMAHALAGPIRPLGARSDDRGRNVRGPIPLYTAGAGDGISFGAPSGHLPRPPPLIGRPGAYAVEAGAGCEPRYRPGEILYVAAGLIAREGDWVVAITRVPTEAGGGCYARHTGRLVALTRARLILSSENGAPDTILSVSRLQAVHPIALSGPADLPSLTRAFL